MLKILERKKRTARHRSEKDTGNYDKIYKSITIDEMLSQLIAHHIGMN